MPDLHLADGRTVPYSIRVSRRSRTVRLTLNARDGLVMVSPPGVDQAWLHELATSWRGWVSKQIERLGVSAAQAGNDAACESLPERIHLEAVDEHWDIVYRYTPSSAPRVRRQADNVLLLSGDCTDVQACRRALRNWLARRARELLPQLLEHLAQETGLRYNSVSIRAQRSRWGSCSSARDITLNQQVLLLPPPMARHILLHELCHTKVLNHSPRFWNLVRRFEPDLDERRIEMRRSWSLVPTWAQR
jgi:predicted metal-dependent hydrolase